MRPGYCRPGSVGTIARQLLGPAIALWHARTELVRIELILALLEASHMTTSPDTNIYCFKCKTKTESNDLQQVVLKNHRDATRATCAVCGTQKFRFGKLG